jgi:hypothetical protein
MRSRKEIKKSIKGLPDAGFFAKIQSAPGDEPGKILLAACRFDARVVEGGFTFLIGKRVSTVAC